MADAVLSDREIQDRLKELSEWSVVEGVLRRVYRTGGWQASMLVAGAIGYICEAADHHADVLVTWPSVTVSLSTHSAGGITGKDVEVARLIERQVTWRPEAGSALAGSSQPLVS
jgi:pterin-4a-carbinolamine dehydratase